MEYKELQKVFWRMTAAILRKDMEKPDKYIRLKYPKNGQPDWKIDEDIVFINSSEKDDAYGKQNDSLLTAENGTVIRRRSRTRVWQVLFSVYGPNSYDYINKIKDGVFAEEVKNYLSRNAVFLIPDLPIAVQANELFAGHWWERWDITLNFNEQYTAPAEDIGHIDNVNILMHANRR